MARTPSCLQDLIQAMQDADVGQCLKVGLSGIIMLGLLKGSVFPMCIRGS